MKKTYFFSISTIVFTILAIIGIYLAAKYYGEYRGFTHPKQLNEDSLTQLDVDDYVQCQVDRYVAVPIGSYRDDQVNGQSEVFIAGLKDYITYTMVVDDESYVRIIVYEEDIVKKLENFQMGKGRTVSFVGKVVEGTDLYTSWYEGAKDFDINRLRSDIAIKQVSGVKLKNLLMTGIFLMIFSLYGVKKSVSAIWTEKK